MQSNTIVTFDLPFTMAYSYVDVLVRITGATSSYISNPICYLDGNRQVTLTLVSLGNSVYRIYGNLTQTYSTHIGFSLTNTHPSIADMHVSWISIKVSSFNVSSFPSTGSVYVSPGDGAWHAMPDASTSVSAWVAETGLVSSSWAGYVSVPQWQKFDYIDVYLTVYTVSLDSLSARCGDLFVPMEIHYLSNPGYGGTYTDDSDGSNVTSSDFKSRSYVRCRLDVSTLQRTLTSGLYIDVTGTYTSFSGSVGLQLNSICGHINTSNYNPITFQLRNIYARLSELVLYFKGDTTSGDAFKQDSAPLISDLDGISSAMDSLSKPSMDNLDTDFSADMSGAGVLMGKLFDEVFSVNWSYTLIIASLTVGVVAYILYGKD